MAAGTPAHAGPWSRRRGPPQRATAHLNSLAPPLGRPTQTFYSPGTPAAPAGAGLHFKAGGSLGPRIKGGNPSGAGGGGSKGDKLPPQAGGGLDGAWRGGDWGGAHPGPASRRARCGSLLRGWRPRGRAPGSLPGEKGSGAAWGPQASITQPHRLRHAPGSDQLEARGQLDFEHCSCLWGGGVLNLWGQGSRPS